MRNDVKLVRGLAVAMISVFLMAGVALATERPARIELGGAGGRQPDRGTDRDR